MTAPLILVVEDDSWLAEQQARVLGRADFRTVISPHAIDAMASIDAVRPDAIVLDVLLTGSTALALLHELQSYGDTASMPIIICTNLASDLNLANLEPYGVKRILDKITMLPDDVVAAVRSVL